MRSYTVDFGTIGANTSGVKTVSITPPAEDEEVLPITRVATWCFPQVMNLNSARNNITVQAINSSTSSHNCSATIVLIYYISY